MRVEFENDAIKVSAAITRGERAGGGREVDRRRVDAAYDVGVSAIIDRYAVGTVETSAADISRIDNICARSVDLGNEHVSQSGIGAKGCAPQTEVGGTRRTGEINIVAGIDRNTTSQVVPAASEIG